jgi:hypothetical protein
MGRRKPPFTPDVAREWDALAFPEGRLDPDEKSARWQALYDRCRQNGEWTVHAFDAALVASMGAYIAIEARDWKLATRMCEEFLEHPNADSDTVDIGRFRSMLGSMRILEGDAEGGMRILDELLSQEPLPRVHLYQVRSELIGLLYLMPPDALLDDRIRQLASKAIGSFRGHKRASLAALSARSREELSELLCATVRRKGG